VAKAFAREAHDSRAGPLTIESILITAVRVYTFKGRQPLTNASGFFFQRDERLFVVTSRHVLIDKPSSHFPDRIEIELHIDQDNLATSTGFSIPLYRNGKSVWRQGLDSAGEIDVAMIEIQRSALPRNTFYRAFTPAHLQPASSPVEVGTSLLVVGFPLGFHDTLHHMPVVRHAVVASSFGLRFQGNGYFLTDARTHRGTSVDAARDPFRSPRYGRKRSRPGRGAGAEQCLVLGYSHDAQRRLSRDASRVHAPDVRTASLRWCPMFGGVQPSTSQLFTLPAGGWAPLALRDSRDASSAVAASGRST
jgi:hypothetical protein